MAKERFFRFGLLTCNIDEDDNDEELIEARIQQNLSDELKEYYCNFGVIDFDDWKIQIKANTPIKFLFIFNVFKYF